MKHLLVVLILAAAIAPAQRPPVRFANQLPMAVRKAVALANDTCREAGGAPGKSPDLVRYADLNGDGIGDYVVDWAAHDCQGAVSAMVNGQSGSMVVVLAGGPGNIAAEAYSASVYGAKIETIAGKSTLWVDVAALDCGQRNAATMPFARWKFCSRPLAWNAARRAFVLGPLAQARPIQ